MRFSRNRFRLVAPWLAAVSLLFALACGTPAQQPARRFAPQASPTEVGTPTPTPTPATSAPPAGNGNASRYADPLERYAYKEAYGRCSALGLASVASFFGGNRHDPVSVAAAYALTSYPQTTRLQPAAQQGCLDGFRDRR